MSFLVNLQGERKRKKMQQQHLEFGSKIQSVSRLTTYFAIILLVPLTFHSHITCINCCFKTSKVLPAIDWMAFYPVDRSFWCDNFREQKHHQRNIQQGKIIWSMFDPLGRPTVVIITISILLVRLRTFVLPENFQIQAKITVRRGCELA